jgi:hypothetical protein
MSRNFSVPVLDGRGVLAGGGGGSVKGVKMPGTRVKRYKRYQ